MKSFVSPGSALLRDAFARRQLLLQLVKRDLKNRYNGSMLGFSWAVINPLLTLLVLVVVFQFGLKAQPLSDVPFAVWLVAGMVPWFFISEATATGAHAILEYDYLVKKIAFRTSLLPLIKVVSALAGHLLFVGLTIGLLVLYGQWPGWAIVQLLYYMSCAVLFLVGVAWTTSSLAAVSKDVVQVINAGLSFLFWLTPLVWDSRGLGENWRMILSLNPIWYVVEGYRDSLVYGRWFYEGDGLIRGAIFWGVTSVLIILGGLIFKRIRPHFADVL